MLLNSIDNDCECVYGNIETLYFISVPNMRVIYI